MRLIDADRLKRQVEGRSYRAKGKFIEMIDSAPTVEADIKCEDCKTITALKAALEPVKRGKWIYDNQFHWYRASCSECGYKRVTDIKAEKWNDWSYCPNCGARMNTEEEHSMEEFMQGQDPGDPEDGRL